MKEIWPERHWYHDPATAISRHGIYYLPLHQKYRPYIIWWLNDDAGYLQARYRELGHYAKPPLRSSLFPKTTTFQDLQDDGIAWPDRFKCEEGGSDCRYGTLHMWMGRWDEISRVGEGIGVFARMKFVK